MLFLAARGVAVVLLVDGVRRVRRSALREDPSRSQTLNVFGLSGWRWTNIFWHQIEND
jgi:hypothetical protein